MSAKAGVKRPRTSYDEQQPTVHVTYKHLTRLEKKSHDSTTCNFKLHEMLKHFCYYVIPSFTTLF
jgi:hypothetical protein